ncbi:conserved exported hypothetical protein [Planktothrix serta PCC 8927]|uniref:Uncharacterized protein n=1 Tax=Planktothrix serta PCC 8927 TaxID=671068 RepID=A0A7Z9BS41_9CYAN|nr:hypothetical protein [Planktothrix serta]VXD16017.1 conserved exported hypothetical protein [Planktothrix serta PCC 8927]
MFKYRILTLATLVTILSLGLTSSGQAEWFSDYTVSPSDWDVEATVDPNQLITVRLRNKTDQTLVYALANDNSQRLAPGKTGEFLVRVGRQPGETSTILINTPEYTYPLIYNFRVIPKNILTIEITSTRADNPHQERTIYIDERGRVYSF